MYKIGNNYINETEIYRKLKKLDFTVEELYDIASYDPVSVFQNLFRNEKYKNYCLQLLLKKYLLLKSTNVLQTIFQDTPAVKFILDNLDNILKLSFNKSIFINYFLCYAKHNNKDLYKLVAYYEDLDVRTEVLDFLSSNDRNYISVVYQNITKYFTLINQDGSIAARMKEIDLSKIATNLFDCKYDEELFAEIKEYIFENYEKNHLLSFMNHVSPSREYDIFHVQEQIEKDFIRLYKTSIDFKYEAFFKYREFVPAKDVNTFILLNNIDLDFDSILSTVYKRGIGDDFVHLLQKYLSISDNTIIKHIGTGSVSEVFQVGNFVVKYISGVHHLVSIEKRYYSCFLTNKVLEEKYYYDEDKKLLGILQVQQKLDNPLREDEKELQILFTNELYNLGYFCQDELVAKDKNNCYRLNDYRDANTDNPESLPEWFKKDPIVLVDLDMMYKVSEKKEIIKQLR